MIALIPARAGSKRCVGKNMRLLNGHPLLAYTIAVAQQSGLFSAIWVSTDDPTTAGYATAWGCQVRLVGAPCHTDTCCDITWVKDVLSAMTRPQTFAILRPTSPFRTVGMLRRAFKAFEEMADCGDSIRAVEPCPVNVYKCWTWDGAGMPIRPLVEGWTPKSVPLHSAPSQLAPKVWIQNSSLEMAHTANVEIHGTIHGKKVGPFFTRKLEGFSIDTEEDFAKAESLAADRPHLLPYIDLAGVAMVGCP